MNVIIHNTIFLAKSTKFGRFYASTVLSLEFYTRRQGVNRICQVQIRAAKLTAFEFNRMSIGFFEVHTDCIVS